ncbi:DUF4402 domain-containing protein [Flavobacterium sp. K5-23]|uniref:DUF4402 domain-containing protein n=1 Tax=Flavobacterium sp. K5-23 TaxID=2746225 RepID=UPI00200CC2D4|nr:DUF4402 domain-containing protein [Flavobacterium sp. K5-23]UQD57332.1 DUF4402 domain-containing protein [Flavobacterium sp. K5-23]
MAILILCCDFSYAQPSLPQRSITVMATQQLHFGTFAVGAGGGSVIVGWDGTRTNTGNITLLSLAPTYQPAIFELKLCAGRSVNISFDPTVNLSGSDGGNLTLHVGPTEKGPNGTTFIINTDCNFVTPLRVGGTLDVPGGSIPGVYTGSFFITFNQE